MGLMKGTTTTTAKTIMTNVGNDGKDNARSGGDGHGDSDGDGHDDNDDDTLAKSTQVLLLLPQLMKGNLSKRHSSDE